MLAGTLLIGCASFKNDLVLNTVGPAPSSTVPAKSGQGTLTVYSANKVNADFNSLDPNRREYSDYRIFDSHRKLIKWVHNVTNDILQRPVPVELPAGKYFVAARANGYGIVTVPVIIEANQETVLRLGGTEWPDESAFNSTNAVRLPDGEIVGWKY